MKRNSLLSFAFVGAALLLGNQFVFTNSVQPPTGYTGAPGEQTCAAAGCHAGNPTLNASDITLQAVGSPSLSSGYASSTQYSLAVNAGSSASYGFSLTAVDGNGSAIGTFALTSPANTSLATGTANKQYVGHKNANSNNAWAFRWTSPATTTDSVFFYLAVNQANGNSATTGDNIRLRTYVATANSFGPYTTGNVGTGIQNLDALANGEITVFPNPVHDKLNLNFNLTETQNVVAGIYNLNGQLVKPLINEELSWGEHDRNFNVAGEMSTGIYIVKFTVGSSDFFKKIVVE